jgi:hypothetical protein
MFSDTFKKVLGYVYFPTDPNRVEKYVHLEKYFFGHGSIPNDQISFYAEKKLSHLHPAARQFCRSTYTITDITIK